MTRRLFSELVRFCIVGVSAAIVNMLIVALWVEGLHWRPLLANIIGFLIAYQVSFWGHRYFTFSQHNIAKQQKAGLKFFSVAVASLVLTEIIYGILLHVAHLQYLLGLFITLLLVPPFTYILSKLWAFKHHDA